MEKVENHEKNRQAWLLYTRTESIRNRAYIELYRQHGRRHGVHIVLKLYEPDKEWDVQRVDALRELVASEIPCFAINRTRDANLAQQLEGLGVRVYNNSEIARLGNDKALAYQYMEQHGIPILRTAYQTDRAPESYPAVVKPCCGHGGAEVTLIENETTWREWKRTHRPKEAGVSRAYVVQRAATDLGRDVRVYVVGNRIVKSVLRTSNSDFRSNYSLGGKAELYELSLQESELVLKIISHFDIGMAGVDFIFDHGQMVFNEIEDMVGARMLYSLTDYDIVEEYVRYIVHDICPERRKNYEQFFQL